MQADADADRVWVASQPSHGYLTTVVLWVAAMLTIACAVAYVDIKRGRQSVFKMALIK